jgi:nitrite reductase (NADH) small subunit
VSGWTSICTLTMLVPERGVCALVDGTQVALFRLADDEVVAISNYDPFSDAYVLSRGIVGTRGDVIKVASPIYKQSFDLRSGLCIDDETVSVPTFGARVVDGVVEVAITP